MRKSIWNPLLLLPGAAIFAISFSGCDTSSTTVASQTVENIAWLPNESGMLAIIEKEYVSQLDGSESLGDNLYNVSSSGSVGNSINPNDVAPNTPADGGTYWNAPIIFVSSDASTAITQFGTDIFKISLSNGNITDIIQNTMLFGVSPDMKYVVTNTTPIGNAAFILTVWNVASDNITIVGQRKTVPGLLSNRVLWLNNDDFALTIYDSTGADQTDYDHVTIYDVNGNMLSVIPNADVSFSAGAFAPDSNELFVRTHASTGIDRINLTTGSRKTVVTNDTIESLDVSSDGTLLVYSSSETTQNLLALYAVNIEDTAKLQLATGISKPVLSPKMDKIACINSSGNIQMVATQFPP